MPGACQAEWVDDRIKAFCEKGYSITLLSSICTFKYNQKGVRHFRIPSFSPNSFQYEYEEMQRRGIKYKPVIAFLFKCYYYICKVLYKILGFLRLRSGEGRWSWFFPSTIVGLLLGVPVMRSEFIYSTGGPASAHLTGILLSKLFGKRIISELQDPLSGDDIGRNGFASRGLRIVEKLIVKHADLTLYCTRNAMLDAKRKYVDFASKIFYVYPGSVSAYDANHASNGMPGTHRVNFTYLGSLYQTRNLDSFMSALRLLAEEIDDIESRIEVNIYGNMNPDIRKRILNFELGMIKIHGLISRDQAMLKATKADVLLLIQNTDDRSIVTIPFKTYDYLHVGKLIFGLIYRNDEIEHMLLSHGHLACQADDVQKIKEILKSLCKDLHSHNKNIRKSELTPQFAADKMIELLVAHNGR